MNGKSVFVALVIIATVGSLTGCGESVHPVTWYKTHNQDMAAMLKTCNGNPLGSLKVPNCVNAFMAKTQIMQAKMDAEITKALAALKAHPGMNFGSAK